MLQMHVQHVLIPYTCTAFLGPSGYFQVLYRTHFGSSNSAGLHVVPERRGSLRQKFVDELAEIAIKQIKACVLACVH